MTLLENCRGPHGPAWALACALCVSTAACSGDGNGGAMGANSPTTGSFGGGSTMASATTGGATTTTGSGTSGGTTTTTGTSSATTGGTTGTTDGGFLAGDGGIPDGGEAEDGSVVDGADGGEGGMAEPKRVPPCIDNDEDVVMIGDSYIDWITHTFIADMRAEAGQQWPSYAVGGTSMASGGLGSIPEQLPQALEDNPDLKMIVMTGGGNDILVADTGMFPRGGECTSTPDAPMIQDCQDIVALALDKAEELMVDAADAGVTDTVYFFYPHIPGGPGSPFSISGPHPNEILDYALPRAREVCESALEVTDGRMKCHFVDMVPVFEGKPDEEVFAIVGDGVHPNSAGSKLMAEEIWRVMQENCLAQPSGSGCCMEPE